MARITRKTQKIFALSARNYGQFGSGQDNTKVLSHDPAVLQANAAWQLGWLSATIGSRKFPPLEEFQSLNYINTYQISYLFQEGIPEYDVGTTYYQNSIVKKPGTYQLYGSLTDTNVGNALTDATNWIFLQDLGVPFAHATTSLFGTVQLAQNSDVVAGSTSTNVMTAALAQQHSFVTGDFKGTTRSALQDGWIWAAGVAGTIGNAASNATGRANADTLALFTLYWNDAAYNYTGTLATAALGQLQVYTSAGAAVAKGANAAADYAANRTIAVVDMRGQVAAGKDNMNGVAAGRLSGQPGGLNGQLLGAFGGAETNSLVEANNGPHYHFLAADITGGAFDTNPPLATNYLQKTGVNSTYLSDYALAGTLSATPTLLRSSTSGSGTPHNNVQPTFVCNYVIKL